MCALNVEKGMGLLMKMEEIEQYHENTEKQYLDLSNQIAENIIREY